jgi:hypothetical protein
MDTESQRKTERLAKTSRLLGILTVAVLVIAALILVYTRFFLGGADWVSGIGYVVVALLLFVVSLILGISATIIALIALKRNREEGDDQTVKKMANLGLVLGLVSVIVILIFFGITWVLSSSTPPPDFSTPIPSTTVP